MNDMGSDVVDDDVRGVMGDDVVMDG